ncbi:MAG TPA: T9SS type A sorting domain-containing protein [Bacteroidia bacterium]|jgi:hypothetical protein|nr:T9SS type A sorting domain-containing protein [Bacteroidia bacterium]
MKAIKDSFLFSMLLCSAAIAQQSTVPKTEKIARTGIIEPLRIHPDPWDVQIANEPERKIFISEANRKLMEEKTKLKQHNANKTISPSKSQTLSPLSPVMHSNFGGLKGGGPPDNGTAVSNGNYIINTINASMAVYDTSGNSLYSMSLTSFFGLPSGSYLTDPRVIYDSYADRFILAITGGNLTEHIAFSQTNNPTGAWNKYDYAPNGNGSSQQYLDYPYCGVTEYEYFMQVLDLQSGNGVLMQISKAEGYKGDSLRIKKWTAGGNVCMANHGQSGSPYGTKAYFVETPGGSAVTLYELSDTLGGNPKLNTYNLTVPNAYSVAGKVSEKGSSSTLEPTDNRVGNAIFLNGTIHFAFQTDYNNLGYWVICYNRINVAAKTMTTYYHTASNSDLCQPSLASFASSPTDKTVLLCYQESNPNIYPSIRTIICDDAGNWSNVLNVKDGTGALNNYGRWGDYTSCTRRHNAKIPTAWLSAEYGSASTPPTWIAEITLNGGTVTGISETPASVQNMKVFPNPLTEDRFTIEFELPADTKQLTISLVDTRGRIVKELFSGEGFAGETSLTFNKNPLGSGLYFVRVNDSDKIVKTAKLLIR